MRWIPWDSYDLMVVLSASVRESQGSSGCSISMAAEVEVSGWLAASWAMHLLENGPKGPAHRCDGRLLRLKFNTNNCKYNVLSLGFQHTLSSKEAKKDKKN